MELSYPEALQAAIDAVEEAQGRQTRIDDIDRKSASDSRAAADALAADETKVQNLRVEIANAMIDSGDNAASIAGSRKALETLRARIAKHQEVIDDRESLVLGLAQKRAAADADLATAAEALRPLATAYFRDVLQAHAQELSAAIDGYLAGLRRGMALASALRIGNLGWALEKVAVPDPFDAQKELIARGRVFRRDGHSEHLATSWREDPELTALAEPLVALRRIESRLQPYFGAADQRKAAAREAERAEREAAAAEFRRSERERVVAEQEAALAAEAAAARAVPYRPRSWITTTA